MGWGGVVAKSRNCLPRNHYLIKLVSQKLLIIKNQGNLSLLL